MKKTLIIALSCLAILFAACKKPVEPTPLEVDYAVEYVGNYLGQFTLTITSMNNQPQTGMSFPIDSITMRIAKADADNVITASVAIENEVYQATGRATAEKIEFDAIPLNLEKPDFTIEGTLELEGTKDRDMLHITGNFSGSGTASIMGQEQSFEEVSGTVNGNLTKQ